MQKNPNYRVGGRVPAGALEFEPDGSSYLVLGRNAYLACWRGGDVEAVQTAAEAGVWASAESWVLCNLDGYSLMSHRRLTYEVARLAEGSFLNNELTAAALQAGY